MSAAAELLRYETVAVRDDEAAANRAWSIDEAGVFHEQRNGATAVRPAGAPLFWYEGAPEARERRVGPEAIGRLRALLAARAPTFSVAPPRADTEGGERIRLTMLGQTWETDRAGRPAVDALLRAVLPLLT